ncbi:hypothetical protein, partial [Lactobacillus gasseri]
IINISIVYAKIFALILPFLTQKKNITQRYVLIQKVVNSSMLPTLFIFLISTKLIVLDPKNIK